MQFHLAADRLSHWGWDVDHLLECLPRQPLVVTCSKLVSRVRDQVGTHVTSSRKKMTLLFDMFFFLLLLCQFSRECFTGSFVLVIAHV